MIKKIFIGIAFFVIIGLVFLLHKSTIKYNVDVIKVDEGWGYDIKQAGEIFIHQPFVPSIQKAMPFPNKRMAKKTAHLVVGKLENGKLPTLTVEEIKNLGIFMEER